jgi:hypothetical protein
MIFLSFLFQLFFYVPADHCLFTIYKSKQIMQTAITETLHKLHIWTNRNMESRFVQNVVNFYSSLLFESTKGFHMNYIKYII